MLKQERPTNNASNKNFIKLDDNRPVEVDHEIGTLIIVILKAKNLNDNHFRKQDVYAHATLNGVTKKTPVDFKGGQNPVWDAEVRFPIMKNTKAKYRKLEVSCYSQEPRPLIDELLGKGVVDLTETLKTGEFDEWVHLEIDGVQRGDIYLEMTYYSNAPVPAKPIQPAATPNNKLLSNLMINNSSSLQRHPSKLSSAERLFRPAQAPRLVSEPSTFVTHPNGSYPQGPLDPKREVYNPVTALPASLTPAYPSNRIFPKDTHETFPLNSPVAHDPLPSLLRPGGRRPSSALPIPISEQQPQGYPHYERPSSSSSPGPQAPYVGSQYGGGSVVNYPCFGGSVSPSPGYPYISPLQPTQNVPPIRRYDSYRASPLDSGTQGFAMPLPTMTPTIENSGRYGPFSQTGVVHQRPITHVRGSSDPAFFARYSTPLPLPPGAETRRVASEVPVASHVSSPFPPNDTRFGALKHAEEEAKIRREQELRDLALAMQLDRELNVS